jgi:hypothetical protein
MGAASLLLILPERAIQAAGEEWPQIAQSRGERVVKKKGSFEVTISSQQDWQIVEPNLRKLCAAILRGRETIREQQIVAERRQALEEESSNAENGKLLSVG